MGNASPFPTSSKGGWEPDLTHNATMKSGFLTNFLWDKADDHPLLAAWAKPVRVMISGAYRHYLDYEAQRLEGTAAEWTDDQKETFDSMITFERFMALLQ